jgi:LPXTG-site transpeptidase (sortase) family protein
MLTARVVVAGALPAVVAVVAGCSAPAPGAPATTPEPPPVSVEALPPGAGDKPVTLTYTAVGVQSAPLEPTGLTPDGEVAVPPVTSDAVVYLDWSARMANRPTVITAHVNTRTPGGSAEPGAFARLADAREGDDVTVVEADGDVLRYRVTSVTSVDKDEFPPEVYAPSDDLVLITCGGDIEIDDRGLRSFDHNELVRAELMP